MKHIRLIIRDYDEQTPEIVSFTLKRTKVSNQKQAVYDTMDELIDKMQKNQKIHRKAITIFLERTNYENNKN